MYCVKRELYAGNLDYHIAHGLGLLGAADGSGDQQRNGEWLSGGGAENE